MIKTVCKNLKSFISITLILCLVAPAYCSMGTADPTAFITKDEFDKALADFNLRLTTFESGINAKIDAQVSSYLDRNGIWSVKPQKLAFMFDANGEAMLWDCKNGSKFDNTGGFAKCVSTEFNTSWLYHDKGKWLMGCYKLVDNISNDGIVFVRGVLGNGKNCNDTGGYVTSAVVHATFKVFTLAYGLSQKDLSDISTDSANYSKGDPGQCIAWQRWSSEAAGGCSGEKTWNVSYPSGLVSMSGFVKKGQPLYFVLGMGSFDSDYSKIKPNSAYPQNLAWKSMQVDLY